MFQALGWTLGNTYINKPDKKICPDEVYIIVVGTQSSLECLPSLSFLLLLLEKILD